MEVWTLPTRKWIKRPSPTTEESESVRVGNKGTGAFRSSRKVAQTSAIAATIRIARNAVSSIGPAAATAITPAVSTVSRKKGNLPTCSPFCGRVSGTFHQISAA